MQARLRPLPAEDLAHALEHAAPDLRALSGEQLFVTGATGFFGLWLLEALAAANARLGTRIRATLLSRDPDGFRQRAPHLASQPAFSWLRGDVRDFAFPAGSFGGVLHGGASSDAASYAARPDEMLETLVAGTRRVLQFAAAARAPRVLLLSSGAVYGRQPVDLPRVPESYAPPPAAAPEAPYAAGKRAAEQLCREAAAGGAAGASIARGFAFVGPHLPLDAHFAAGNFLRDALAGREIAVAGDGTPLRSYLHMADLVVWLLAILVRGKPLRTYNVGSDQAVSIAGLAHEAARLRRPALPVRVARAPGGAPPERYVPDVSRARAELGLEVRISLRAAFERTFRWLRRA